jgi:hypothetical protein
MPQFPLELLSAYESAVPFQKQPSPSTAPREHNGNLPGPARREESSTRLL